MSADNYLLISKKNFKVMHMCASTGYGNVVYKGKSLEDAIEGAEKLEMKAIEDGYYIEYGIHFTDDKIGTGYKEDEMLEEKKKDIKTIEQVVDKMNALEGIIGMYKELTDEQKKLFNEVIKRR